MSTEWTIATLKEHFEREIEHVRELHKHDLAAAQEALNKADHHIEARLSALNELRGMVSDQQNSFVYRTAWDLVNQATADKISALSSRLDRSDGRGSGLNAGWGYLVAAIATVAIVIDVVVRLYK